MSIALSGCSSKVEVQYLTPPLAYTTTCERTPFNGKTYGDAVQHLLKVMAERDLCASQVDKIREWQREMVQN
ncbi:hypothetical protein GVX86_01505 [[Haemophilus] felis]|nr:hypothetical protein [[Haemophilus] felis]